MHRKEVFSNGLTLLTEEMPNLRSVSLGVWLKQGSRHESADENGVSHFIEHLLFKGTERRTAAEIAKTIDAIGGQCDAFTSKEYTCFYARVLDQHLPLAVDLLSDIVLHPRFDPQNIEKERKVIFEEIKMVEDSPDELVYDLFTETFWKEHPLGRPIQGTVESVSALGQDRLMRFFREAYNPDRVVIAAAGNLSHEPFVGEVREAFGKMPSNGSARPIAPPRAHAGIVTREKKDLEQLHVCLGVEAYEQGHRDRYAGYVMNTMLGGTMSSRLFQRIREERGLAYTVFSSINSFQDTGYMMVYAATRPGGGQEVLDRVCEELARLKEVPIEQAELDAAKDHLKGSLMLSLESSSSRMSNLARQDIYYGRQYSLDEIVTGIDQVQREDVQRLARTMLVSSRCTVAVLGNLQKLNLSPERIGF
ncbi:MAG TPA: pitrilysin family protein [Candidatus Polarisedimenticolia bacterium]|nr:pitrilysin family protein [Candidatus Polarisedimenticolia bacterium]